MSTEAEKIDKGDIINYEEIHYDITLAKKLSKFKKAINQNPPKAWIKTEPYSGSLYVPIDKVEWLLDSIFQEWKTEILREGVMLNSIFAVVRLHYIHPVTGKWEYHDGAGAQNLQLDSGSAPTDFTKLKPASVKMALPMAVSFAIKDAADHLGKIFGRDTNRKFAIEFSSPYDKPEVPKDKSEERIIKMIEDAKTIVGLEKYKVHCTSIKALQAYDLKYEELKQKV